MDAESIIASICIRTTAAFLVHCIIGHIIKAT